MKVFFAAEFTKNTGETIAWKAESVGMLTMTKKVVTFLRKNSVTPSVTAPGDTNLKPCFSTPNRAWLLVGRPKSGRWVLPERLWYTRMVTMELNGNKNRRATFSAF